MNLYIKTFTGNYFNFIEPNIFDIDDIAHALSNICRFVGHCKNFYSVAQHSVLVSYHVPNEHALAGLLHDGAEAYLGDVSKPLKTLLPDYQIIEQRIEQALFKHYNLPTELHSSIKQADLILLRTEQRDIMDADKHDWPMTKDINPLPYKIIPFSPSGAEQVFLERYRELTS